MPDVTNWAPLRRVWWLPLGLIVGIIVNYIVRGEGRVLATVAVGVGTAWAWGTILVLGIPFIIRTFRGGR